ncbi:MAG: hypothetical protein IPH65_04750 [Dehalococcoidia bacterium]|uniref:hypothetical protein n=1 Tax=Candidatus Amarobacter glycogenicus TaxID=3140699 RepID=UPI0031350D25|nr:hypothetical protein [Dehalococcoidia bacterium]
MDEWWAVSSDTEVETKFFEWKNLLAQVYGEDLGDAGLFATHLSSTIRPNARVYRSDTSTSAPEQLSRMVDGPAFATLGILNFVEGDFFAWVLEPLWAPVRSTR